MKYSHLFSLLLIGLSLVPGTACKKNSSTSNPTGCITRYQPDITQRVLPQAQYDSAKQFFEANGLSLDTLQPLLFTTSPSAGPGLFYQVPTRRLINGLPVANASLKYNFQNGKLVLTDTSGYSVPLQNNDNTAHTSLEKLRAIFLASDPDSYANTSNLVAVPTHQTHWADSCIVAMLQYSDKYFFDCCTGTEVHVLIKTWSIQSRPESNSLATIVDETGKIYPTIIFTLH